MRFRSLSPSIVLVACAFTAATRARAASTFEDPYDLPYAPRPISLPELTHPDIEWTAATAIGSVSGPTRTSPAIVERLSVEVPIGLRRWFAGAAYDFADASPTGTAGGSRVLGGNVEVYGRTVWATRTGLAFGSGLGLIPPIATFDSGGSSGDAAMTATSLQPWDYAFFRSGYATAHPFVDVRDITGPFVVQFRQSFDWSFRARDWSDSVVTASSALYFGYRAARLMSVGVEATEVYRIDDPIPDDGRRATFIVAPSVRFLTRLVEPAISVFGGVGHPLAPAADSVWGVRVAFTFVWDPRRISDDEAP